VQPGVDATGENATDAITNEIKNKGYWCWSGILFRSCYA